MKNLKPRQQAMRRRIYAVALGIPPLVSLVTIGLLLTKKAAPVISAEGILLSPMPDPIPLVVSLGIFTLGYLVFIGMLFRQSISKTIKRMRSQP